MSIMLEILLEDAKDNSRTMGDSFLFFKELILQHSVERPPKSVGIFSVENVSEIFDFTTTR